MTIRNFQEVYQKCKHQLAVNWTTPDVVEAIKLRLMVAVNIFTEESGLLFDATDSSRLDIIFELSPEDQLGFDTSVAISELEEFLVAA